MAEDEANASSLDTSSGCLWIPQNSGSYYLCDVAIGSAAVIKTLNAVAWPVLTNAGGLTVKSGTCASEDTVTFSTEDHTASIKVGTTLCVSIAADNGSSSIDTTTGCPDSAWVVSGETATCTFEMPASAAAIAASYTAWPVLTKGSGDVTVKTGDCNGTAVAFGEGTTASIKAGTTLCASAPADSVSSSIDTTTGCPGSAWVVDDTTATCTFAMPSSAAAIAASYTAWPVLTSGDTASITVKSGSCGDDGIAVVFTETEENSGIWTAAMRPGTTLCAKVSASTGDPARPLGTMTGCPGGSWSVADGMATCIFTMPTTDSTVEAVYAPIASCNLQWPLYIVPSVTNSNVDAAFTGTENITVYGRTSAAVSHIKLIYGTGTPDVTTWQGVDATENLNPTNLGNGFTKEYQATLSADVLNALAGVETSYLFAVSGDGENWFYCPGTQAGGAPTQAAASITDTGRILIPAASDP